MKTLNLKTKSFRKIPNPFYNIDTYMDNSEMYIMICDVKDIPKDIPMDTNPREQKLTTAVAKKIRASLISERSNNFYLLNRGLTISAKSVKYDNKNDLVTIEFDDNEVHGDIDGGHTYKIILQEQENLDYGEQFVKIEVLTGVEDIFQELAAARNTSVQVQDKSIAELEDRFEIIKEAIKDEPYSNNIYFKENDVGDIDVTDIIAILNLFNIERYPNKNENPIISYSGKGQCIKNYITTHKELRDTIENPYVKMKYVIPDIFKLYDHLEKSMRKFYSNGISNKKYGAVTGVTPKKDGKEAFKTKFYKENMDYLTPNGFIYPILGAFRALLKENNEHFYEWKKDPFMTMDKIGAELVSSTVNMSRELGNNPNATGKNKTLWMNLYMIVCMELVVM